MPKQTILDKNLVRMESLPPRIIAFLQLESFLRSEMPATADFLLQEGEFRGISLLPGNSGGFLLILKKWGDGGKPEVLFHHEKSPLEAFMAIEGALEEGNWKADKSAPNH